MKIKKLLEKSYFWVEVAKMHYYYFTSRKDYTKALKYFGEERDLSNDNGRCMSLQSDNRQTFVLIGNFEGKECDLAHECVHAALFTFDIIGQNLDAGCEMLPHLTDTIFSKCKEIERK